MDVQKLPEVVNGDLLSQEGLMRYTLFDVTDREGRGKYIVRIDPAGLSASEIVAAFKAGTPRLVAKVLGGRRIMSKPQGKPVIEYLGRCGDIAPDPTLYVAGALMHRQFPALAIVGQGRPMH